MDEPNLVKCESCGAGLLSVSDICPQCGWLKNNHITPAEVEEKAVEEETTEEQIVVEGNSPAKKISKSKVKKKMLRPNSIRLLSIFYLVIGISLIIFAIGFVSAVGFVVMSTGMDGLSEIGGSGLQNMGNSMMPLGMGDMDASTKSSLNDIIELHEITGSPSVYELERRINLNEVNPNSNLNSNTILSKSLLNVEEIMDIMMETAITATVEISIGVFVAMIGIGFLKGKRAARLVIIPTVIISIPLMLLFAEGIDNMILLGMASFAGITLYCMFKPQVRNYFAKPQ